MWIHSMPIWMRSIRTRKPCSSRKSNNQIMEYLPNVTNLKAYALQHWSAQPPTGPKVKPQCYEQGGLGDWLRSLHNWGSLPEQVSLREALVASGEMQTIKYMYDKLPGNLRLIDRHLSILCEA